MPSTARPSGTALALTALALGCAADAAPEPTAEDRAAAEAELATVVQALGEPACGTLPADAVYMGSGIPTANDLDYGQSGCSGGYIVDARGLRAGQQLRGGARAFLSDPFTCLFTWGYVSLWQPNATGGYSYLSEASGLGSMRRSRTGNYCDAKGVLTVPANGDYRVVVAGGLLFGFALPAQLEVR